MAQKKELSVMKHPRHRIFSILLSTSVAFWAACDDSSQDADSVSQTQSISPFSLSVQAKDTTVSAVTAAIASYLNDVDDSVRGLAADWVIAGGDALEAEQEAAEAALKLPNGSRIIEVCNHHYASMAMSFGGHHGVALPCEIAINQTEDDVEVVMLNPEAIFSAFFADVSSEYSGELAGMAATVRQELEDLILLSLESDFDSEVIQQDLDPAWDQETLADLGSRVYSIEMNIDIPAADQVDDASRAAFKADFVEELLGTLTHENSAVVGSSVADLSVSDWRSARPHALSLPAGVSVVEVCSPTYANAALSTGSHHAPALPCEISIWAEEDELKVHVLDPNFIFGAFFSDAPVEMQAQIGPMAQAVQGDILKMVSAAQTTFLSTR
jgi:uncharacterized protein (DUF302 family)